MENLQATYRNIVRTPQSAATKRSTTAPEAAVMRYTVSPVIIIFSTSLAAEVILPWVAIWLSDTLFFDIPGWSLWLLFGVPPAVSLMAVLVHWAWRISAKHLSRLPAREWRGGIGTGSCC
jgi:hypothetical protein